MKNILFILIGMGVMYGLLTVLSKPKKSTGEPDESADLFLKLAVTPEAKNLIKSQQFKAVLKTQEFKDLFNTLSDEYLTAFSASLLKG